MRSLTNRTLAFAVVSCAIVTSALSQTPIPVTFQNGWAGYILYSPGETGGIIPNYRFSKIEAEWVVPFARATINCTNRHESTDGSALWIGLDGWDATYQIGPGQWASDVLQAGTETDVACGTPAEDLSGASAPQQTSYFWIEWAGTQNIPLTDKNLQTLPVNPGDRVSVQIAADTSDWQHATVFFQNLTTGYSLTTTFEAGVITRGSKGLQPFVVSIPTLFGNTAEWVVETTFDEYAKHPAPNTTNDFNVAQFTNMKLYDSFGNLYTPQNPTPPNISVPSKQEIDWMTVGGNPISSGDTLWACAALLGPTDPNSSTSTILQLERAPYQMNPLVSPGQQGTLEPKPTTCSGMVPPAATTTGNRPAFAPKIHDGVH